MNNEYFYERINNRIILRVYLPNKSNKYNDCVLFMRFPNWCFSFEIYRVVANDIIIIVIKL